MSLITCRTLNQIPEQRIIVNFDEERGRAPRDPANPDICRVVIRPSKQIRMAVIQAYLSNKMPFDHSILEAISKLISIHLKYLRLTFRRFP